MMSKTVTLVLGCLLVIIGAVWFFQGIGSLAGSPMTGVSFWAFAGVVVLLVGAYLLLRGLRGRRGSSSG